MEYSMSIPEEILFDIFSWLPVKSLMRFRCISQYFNSLVCEPYFVDIHQCHSRIRTKLLVRQWDLVGKRNFYYTIEQNASHRRVHIEDYFDGLTNVIDLKGYFVECVNGLFCFWSCISQVVVICNPSTRQVRFLPCIKHEYDGLGHGQFLFGYEPKDEVYKVVFVKRDEHDISAARCWIFSLGIDESWKEIDRAPCCFYYGQECVCIKGVIYVSSGNSQEQNIIAFDLKGESFRIIALWKDALPYYFNLIEMEGKLGIVENNTMINGETINLWMLGNIGWERHVIIGFPMEGCPIVHCLSQTYGGKINIIFIAKVNQSCDDTLSYLLCCYDFSRKSWTRREIINGGWIQHIYRWVETLFPLKHICIDADSTSRV
ncbi:hypothetical protein H5410_038345 [Solanum commersonii]|uniref:F-box domain-containing protein n=1 Tax=Solanum commersonii TaxID=4109 RepID=A0A9J5Y9T6_SOLCO|nr:hypothetical protein H5410_038345 [Solanum commersonii]